MPASVSDAGAPRVSVIIPNWNGAAHLRICLPALARQTFRDFEIIVVDNGSTDDSREWLARALPDVRVVALDRNRGVAGGFNAGIEAARGAVLVLLNNDTEPEADWLQELVGALARNAGAGMAASKLRLFDRRECLHSAGDFYGVNGIPGNRGVWEVDAGQYDNPGAAPPVFGVCGGAAAYRRELFAAVGGFDTDLGSYCEDVDLNWRARLAGFDCVLAPRAIVYHRLSATGGGALASYFVGRNVIAVLVKNYPGALFKKYWKPIVRAQLAIARDALKNRRGAAARARLRGQLAGLLALPRFWRKRRQIQASRRAALPELERLLAKP